MEDQETLNNEGGVASPKHLRKALDSLPSFDFEPEAPTQEDPDQTVIVIRTPHEEEDDSSSTADEGSSVAVESAPSDDVVAVVMPDNDDAAIASDPTVLLSADETVVTTDDAAVNTDGASPADDGADEALATLVSAQPVSYEPQEPATVVIPEAEVVSEGVQPIESPLQSMDSEKKSGTIKKTLKRVLVILLATAGALAVIYLIGGFYFTSHFFPNTTVNGEDVSGLSVSDLSAYVSSIGENYKVQISGDGIDMTIAGPDIGFVYDGEAYSQQAAEQIDTWHWPAELNQSHEYVVDQAISFDQQKLDETVGAAVDKANEGASQPTNATLAYDEAAGAFAVVPDALGTAINRDAVLGVASEGVATMQTSIQLGDDQLVQPTIAADNEMLLETMSAINGMLDSTVTLRIAGTDATTIDKNLMASWLSVDGDININVNQDAIKEWAQGPLSEQFDTIGTKRTFTRPDGKVIEVEGASGDFEYDYGWWLDGEALSGVLAENLRNRVTDPIDVPMRRSAASWNPGGQEWPNRYIDVDLSEQHVRMYDDSSNVIWESDCVSGNPIYGGGTDTGVFFIYMKSSPMELVGLDYNGDNEPDYRTWVTYWMPFDGGEGLHDMSSRYYFGGDIYTYNGSHGCVNLPYSAAEQLYGITNVGDVVIVHW